ncbi:hypothetical protein ACFXG4_17830 [Nocardia sp. NPDC059246]|uniref:hypothetical protein n=1 Tax=unclassified Nocardia TaxID=2637762 RepID=UPI0036A81DEF
MLVAFGVFGDRGRRIAEFESGEVPLGPISVAVVVVGVTLLDSEWVARHGDTAIRIVAAVAVTVAGAVATAFLLPGRDGTLVLLAVAFVSAGGAIVAVSLPRWIVPVLFVCVAAGFTLGRVRPAPLAGMAATLLIALFAVLTAGSLEHVTVIPTVGTAAVSTIAGYCYGSALPRTALSVMAGLAVLFVPPAGVAMRVRDFSHLSRSPQWSGGHAVVSDAAPGWGRRR